MGPSDPARTGTLSKRHDEVFGLEINPLSSTDIVRRPAGPTPLGATAPAGGVTPPPAGNRAGGPADFTDVASDPLS
jgi:hypothetical protein